MAYLKFTYFSIKGIIYIKYNGGTSLTGDVFISYDNGRDCGKVVSLTHRPSLPPGNAPGTHFC